MSYRCGDLVRAGGLTDHEFVSIVLAAALVFGSGTISTVQGRYDTANATIVAMQGVSSAEASVCPHAAVFLALEDQVRGYSADAQGPTLPCQVLGGPLTTLSSARSLALSVNGLLHVVQFLTNGSFSVFQSDATGNTAPTRTVFTDTNDLTGIALDSHLHDYVLSIRGGPRVLVYRGGASGQQPSEAVITDPALAVVAGIAVDPDDNLLIAGYQADGQARVDTYNTGTTLGTSTKLIRSLVGARTGLLPGSTNMFDSETLSIAVNPVTGELFVFSSSTKSEVSVFSRWASGDVPPERVILGPLTKIVGTGVLGTNKIAVAGDGRLFVAQPNDTVLVFASNASGNVAPLTEITDRSPGLGTQDEGGIAVR